MKLITKVIFLLALTFTPAFLSAQTVESVANNIKWSLYPSWPDAGTLGVTAYNSSGSSYTEGLSTGLLKIDDKSIIANVQLDKNNYGVVRFDKTLNTEWLTTIEGFPLCIGMLHDKVLVISTPDISIRKGITNSYNGYIIDAKNGKILLQKKIYTSSDDYYEQPVFLIPPTGSLFKIAIRTSTLTKKLHFSLAFSQNKAAAEYFDTKEFKILEYDDNLVLKTTITPTLPEGYFIGATTNKNGDVFLMSDVNQGFIKVAKYENGKVTPAKVLQLSVNMSDEEVDNLQDDYLFTSKGDPSVLFFAATYRNTDKKKELVVAKFNFNDGTVANDIQVMDKPYLKDMAKSYVPFNKKFDDVDLGDRNYFDIRNIVENDGKLIVCIGSHTESGGSAAAGTHNVYTARDLVINMYNSKSQLQYQQIIPRKYGMFYRGYNTAGLHCNNNTLYITANNNKGLNGNKALFSMIDLKTGAITNIGFVEKTDIKNAYSIDPKSSIWFDNKLMLNYMQDKGLSAGSEDAHIQLVDF